MNNISPRFAAKVVLRKTPMTQEHVKNWHNLDKGEERQVLKSAVREYEEAAANDTYQSPNNEIMFYHLDGETGAIGGLDLNLLQNSATQKSIYKTLPEASLGMDLLGKFRWFSFWNLDDMEHVANETRTFVRDFLQGKLKLY